MDLREFANKNLDADEARKIYESDNNVYYVVKSSSDKNVRIALKRNAWATTPKNEKVFEEAYDKGSNVVLLFSINASSQYIGYALMKSKPGKSAIKENIFYFPDGRKFKGNKFDISWIRVVELPFCDCNDLHNKLNNNLPVKVGRDGQQIDPEAGKELCLRFEKRLQQKYFASEGQIHDNLPLLCTPSYSLSPRPPNGVMPQFFGVPGTYYNLPLHQTGTSHHMQQHIISHYFPQAVAGQDLQPQSSLALDDALISAEYNPALSIFPADMTNISYAHYNSLYNISHHFWTSGPESKVKREED